MTEEQFEKLGFSITDQRRWKAELEAENANLCRIDQENPEGCEACQ